MTKQFAKRIDEMGLLVPQTLTINHQDGTPAHDVSGFFIVDREKLNKLSDEDYLELRKNGALEVIYHHLMSLDSLDKLIRKKNMKGVTPPPTSADGMEGGASAPKT